MDSDCDGSTDEDKDITTGKGTQEVSIIQHEILFFLKSQYITIYIGE